MKTMIDILKLTGICPILACAEPDQAASAARAMVEGGLPVIEVLQRDENAFRNLKTIVREVPEAYAGAGTVLTARQAEEVIDAGAKFVVMPGFKKEVVETCLRHNVMVIPGCCTPTELMMIADYGIRIAKFFPFYQMGGVSGLNEVSGPYPDMRFIVTGALHSGNFLPALESPKTLAAGGDWMFQEHDALKNRDYKQVSANMRHSVLKVLNWRASRAAE